MRVFLCYSRDRSKAVASALHIWLCKVIQAVEPWTADVDVDRGSTWIAEISFQLHDTSVGLICLPPEDKDRHWILFEAGALSRALETSRVCIYLFDLKYPSHCWPLAMFQHSEANREDTRKLLPTLLNWCSGQIRLKKHLATLHGEMEYLGSKLGKMTATIGGQTLDITAEQ